ncbi:MAG: glycerophosphodiester phosphodiesterase [Deltaproteobacteria bacterium]|nr:glycerophosphodiester phosphodiesterase [Deltaproteobacteria bacterium]
MELSRFRRAPGSRPVVYGHRGAKAHVVENTLPSFERAIADGADGVELDVRTTRDGVVVVMHDLDVKRMTGGRDPRLVQELSAQELSAIELEGPAGPARAPTLGDVLDWADARDVLVNIELKHDTHDKAALANGVARLIRSRRRARPARLMFSSFEPELLARIAVAAPDLPRAFLIHAGQRLAKTLVAPLVAKATRSFALNPERTLCSPDRVAGWHRRGLMVNVWTVNDPREAIDLARIGVDGLITDDPATVLAALSPSRSAARDSDR